ncbi:hypothetical protein LCGC14_1512510 [marine sediment metagenome]|uniref:Uncharacterized protein n=1 Tax=marine sediment metagenome TaxID=412755 RepID=A0A0F9JLS6_9ZZZZ|nr:hypothetical protein [Desulfobacterales bacterium]
MFRKLSVKYFEPISMWVIIFGIFSLCQPWNLFFHVYGFLIILIGLVGFIFFSHIKPLPEEE